MVAERHGAGPKDRERRRRAIGVGGVVLGQLAGDPLEPGHEQRRRPGVERRERADDAGLALGEDQVGRRDDEQRRPDHGQAQAVNDAVTVAEDSGATVINVRANDTGLGDAPITTTAAETSSRNTAGSRRLHTRGQAYHDLAWDACENPRPTSPGTLIGREQFGSVGSGAMD